MIANGSLVARQLLANVFELRTFEGIWQSRLLKSFEEIVLQANGLLHDVCKLLTNGVE
jgi:hypothetical protein